MQLTPNETEEPRQPLTSDAPLAIEDPTGRVGEQAALEFGRFRVLLRQRRLLADGVPVELGGRAFEVLLVLLQANGALVSKDQLLARVWPGIVVAPDNLKVQVCALRKALGEDCDFVRTESGRGYRFIAAVHRVSIAEPERLPVAEALRAPAGSNAPLPVQLSAIAAQLAGLEAKLGEALQLLNERSQYDPGQFRRHSHWVGFSDRTRHRSSPGQGADAGRVAMFAKSR